MDLRNVFINNLKKYRKKKRFSQSKLAEMTGTSTSYIGEIEIGKKFPSIEMIQKFAVALEIEPYKLFVENDKNSKPVVSESAKDDIVSTLNELISKVQEFASE